MSFVAWGINIAKTAHWTIQGLKFLLVFDLCAKHWYGKILFPWFEVEILVVLFSLRMEDSDASSVFGFYCVFTVYPIFGLVEKMQENKSKFWILKSKYHSLLWTELEFTSGIQIHSISTIPNKTSLALTDAY